METHFPAADNARTPMTTCLRSDDALDLLVVDLSGDARLIGAAHQTIENVKLDLDSPVGDDCAVACAMSHSSAEHAACIKTDLPASGANTFLEIQPTAIKEGSASIEAEYACRVLVAGQQGPSKCFTKKSATSEELGKAPAEQQHQSDIKAAASTAADQLADAVDMNSEAVRTSEEAKTSMAPRASIETHIGGGSAVASVEDHLPAVGSGDAQDPHLARGDDGACTSAEDGHLQEQASTILNKFTVLPPPRLVVCGRCGIGKSILINCLLRLPSTVSPKIESKSTSTPKLLEDVSYFHAGVIFQKLDISEDSLTEQDIDKYELQMADACIFVYEGELPDAMLDFADTLEARSTPTFLVRVGKTCSPTDDDAFHELDLPLDSTSMWTSEFQSDLECLKSCVEAGIQESGKRAQVNAVLSGDAEKLAEVRATECWDYYNALLATSTGAGAVPAPGVPTLVIMILVATMLFLKIFCLIPSSTDRREHAELLQGFARKITPRVLAVGATFITADMGKDGLLVIPIAGVVITTVLGGVVSAAAMHILCKDLIPRLQSVATAFYKLDMNRIVEQKALDEFNDMVDKVFPMSVHDQQDDDAAPRQDIETDAPEVSQDIQHAAAAQQTEPTGDEPSSGETVRSSWTSMWNYLGYESDLAELRERDLPAAESCDPFGDTSGHERDEIDSTACQGQSATESAQLGASAAGDEALCRGGSRSSFASVLRYFGYESDTGNSHDQHPADAYEVDGSANTCPPSSSDCSNDRECEPFSRAECRL